MTEPEHVHDFRPARVVNSRGVQYEGGRACPCGVEVVGIPYGINAEFLRAGERFNRALGEAFNEMGRRFAAASREANRRVAEEQRRRRNR